MREIRQSGSEGGGNEQTVSPYPYFTFSPISTTFFTVPKPTHCAGYVASFYLPFIWVSLFKDRVVAMGKPHCNSSI
jgi:hypothetical protein